MITVVATILISLSGAADTDNQSIAAKLFSQTSSVVETLIDQINPLLLVEDGDGNGG